MRTPVLHVLAGPNGAGKSTFVHEVLQPVTRLPFVNADEIAAARWPGDEEAHAYEASAAAADAREQAMKQGASFITETVFSHVSKLELVARAHNAGYLVELHVMLIPEDLAVHRVAYRVSRGGHAVPEDKIRERFRRLWALVGQARSITDRATFYDNTRSVPFTVVARFERGRLAQEAAWPAWTPPELTDTRLA